MRTLSMRLKLGICPDAEKNAKKEVILDYLQSHYKVICLFQTKIVYYKQV